MTLRQDSKVAAAPREGLKQAVREAQERLDEYYPADWDYYEALVANPPSGRITVPHKITGELVPVDLLTITPDEIIEQCGIPDHMRERSLQGYRLILEKRLPHWDRNLLPSTIPLLEDGNS